MASQSAQAACEQASSEVTGDGATSGEPANAPGECTGDNVPRPSGSASSVSAVADSSEARQPGEDELLSRPTDEQIIQQRNTILAEQAQSALIGTKEPLSVLEEEYKHGSDMFIEKLQFLQEEYDSVRRVRRDGNCFYRGFIFGYLEALIATQNWKERDRVAKSMDASREKLIRAGFQELVFEDALSVIQEKLSQISRVSDPLSIPEWEIFMTEENLSCYIIMFLRFLTSCEIQLRREYFEPFIMGISDIYDVELFCRRMVEPMGEESDEVHISALTDALMIPIRVYSIDTHGAAELRPVTYVPEGCQDPTPLVHLLYRPGHYDIMYPKAS